MAGICSRHHPSLGPVEGCPACHATPAQLMGVSQDEWDKAVACAEEAGLYSCRNCDFVYYKTTDLCPLCSHPREDTITTTRGSWWTAIKNWLDTIAIAFSFGPPF